MAQDNQLPFHLWVTAAGTVASAVSITIDHDDLDLIGNALQAVGNGLAANQGHTFSIETAGSLIQSSGNTAIIYSLLADLPENEQLSLVIKGNLLQALGGSAAFSGTLTGPSAPYSIYTLNGQLMEVIGNSMQAVGTGKERRGEEGYALNLIGSWIQAGGAVLSALAGSAQLNHEIKDGEHPSFI
ncbi:hypothetical protein GLW04_00935 [Halobacillus litoralis]|uniref:Uncharacterized protein n=1 Tax=Halobacillus litoralis TaxID=45668 RepID=A0A845DPX6_9BACI|nr:MULTISPECIES: hypothetical protein [Halobacillus]MYL18432.1 hypothetical protein [Halobacillus litoralis]MYL30561.1 hypothetical protein [Halobacillus halophilus]